MQILNLVLRLYWFFDLFFNQTIFLSRPSRFLRAFNNCEKHYKETTVYASTRVVINIQCQNRNYSVLFLSVISVISGLVFNELKHEDQPPGLEENQSHHSVQLFAFLQGNDGSFPGPCRTHNKIDRLCQGSNSQLLQQHNPIILLTWAFHLQCSSSLPCTETICLWLP